MISPNEKILESEKNFKLKSEIEVDILQNKLSNDKILSMEQLQHSLGQLNYLKNLQKKKNLNQSEFSKEICAVFFDFLIFFF